MKKVWDSVYTWADFFFQISDLTFVGPESNSLALRDAVRKQKKIEDLFWSGLSQFKRYHISENLKFNNLGIFKS